MTTEHAAGAFDCAQHTPEVATVANVLWADADTAVVLVDADRRLLAFNAAAVPSLGDEGVRIGGDLTGRLRRIWLDDEVDECPPERNPLLLAYSGVSTRRQMVRFSTESYQEQGRMRVSTVPVALHDGSRGVLLCWQEVVAAERRDRREIRRMEQLLEGASDYAIVVMGPAGRVQTWSRSAERLYGYSSTEAADLPFAGLFPERAVLEELPEQILAEARSAGSARTENLRLHKNGSVFWAQGAVSVLRDDVGDACGYVEVAHDVSEQRAAEQKIHLLNDRLRELNQELEDRIAERTEQLVRQTAELTSANAELEGFSYSVSHNLRAPLRAIGGYARLIEESCAEPLPAKAVEYLHKLTNSAVMMGQLIDGLIELSTSQRVGLQIEDLDMERLVRDCWEALAQDQAGRKIELILGELPPAEGDCRLIYQVWMNLLQNAIKYTSTRAKARISVTATVRDGVIWYRVEDNGVGFDMKYAHKIGQVFQRLHDGSEFSGTGVGMASVQRIVLRHGGSVVVRGEPNVGARMEFSLWGER